MDVEHEKSKMRRVSKRMSQVVYETPNELHLPPINSPNGSATKDFMTPLAHKYHRHSQPNLVKQFTDRSDLNMHLQSPRNLSLKLSRINGGHVKPIQASSPQQKLKKELEIKAQIIERDGSKDSMKRYNRIVDEEQREQIENGTKLKLLCQYNPQFQRSMMSSNRSKTRIFP